MQIKEEKKSHTANIEYWKIPSKIEKVDKETEIEKLNS